MQPVIHSLKRSIPLTTKRDVAFQALGGKPISHIAKSYNCSRNTVYTQKSIAVEAANNAFMPKVDDALFYIAVNDEFIKQMVVALLCICKASYRDIKILLMQIFTYRLSIGSIFSILNEAGATANKINNSYDLSSIKNAASDEIFHLGQPILTTVDLPSRYCTQALKVDDKEGETWAISIMEMMDQGFKPDVVVADGAGGIAKGYSTALPNTTLRYDHFHVLYEMKKAKASINRKLEQLTKLLLSPADNFEIADKFIELTKVQQTFNTLTNWLQHDVLQLAGTAPAIRTELFDFIVDELKQLTSVPAIVKITTTLRLQKDLILDAANSLDAKFILIAEAHQLPLELIWKICYLARYDYDSFNYQIKSAQLELLANKCYDEVEEKVLQALATTYRSSSMVENLNGRLAAYLPNNKPYNQPILDLIRCYLNHKPFARSYHEDLVNKSPAQILTGKEHKPFLQLLGFPPVTKIAA